MAAKAVASEGKGTPADFKDCDAVRARETRTREGVRRSLGDARKCCHNPQYAGTAPVLSGGGPFHHGQWTLHLLRESGRRGGCYGA